MKDFLSLSGGKTEAERVKVDIMADTAMDFRNGAVGLFYNPNFVSFYF